MIGERCTIGDDATLRESILWPGTVIAAGSVLIGPIAGQYGLTHPRLLR